MADEGKDPAMLWYWSDWNSGTTTFSRFLKGCYMDLLHAQFHQGHLSLEEIRTVLGSDFGQAWPTLQKKFKNDDAGRFYNRRLEIEQIKRAAFTASRRKNLESSHMKDHMDEHMGSHMENVNVNEIETFGIKKEWWICVKRKTTKEKHRKVYDLRLYFEHTGQLEAFERSKFTLFDEFLKANPSKFFNDADHLYNAYRKFCVGDQLEKVGIKKPIKKHTIDELNQQR